MHRPTFHTQLTELLSFERNDDLDHNDRHHKLLNCL